MEEINMEALNMALDHIVAHPEEWDQDSFVFQNLNSTGEVCGTTFCLAGTVCYMNLPMKIDRRNGLPKGINTKTGREIHWESDAERILNIPSTLSWALFYNTGNVYDVVDGTHWTSAQDYVNWVREVVRIYQQTGIVEPIPDAIDITELNV